MYAPCPIAIDPVAAKSVAVPGPNAIDSRPRARAHAPKAYAASPEPAGTFAA